MSKVTEYYKGSALTAPALVLENNALRDEIEALKAQRDALRAYYEYTSEYAKMPASTLPEFKPLVQKIISLGAHKP